MILSPRSRQGENYGRGKMFKKDWRLILQKDTSAAYGLAVDEVTALSVARNDSPPILHLYNFLPCVILGRYQSAEEALNIQECRERGLEINRRHTGGGTVLMGPKQLALGFSIPKNYPGVGPSINNIFNNLGGILCEALNNLGIKARFRPKNDIEVNKKKIAGLSASLEERDVAFFHTSLLLDFNFKLMLKVFKLPIKKLSDKHITCFTDRMTTLRASRHRNVDLPSFQSMVRKAFEERFGIKFRIDTLNQWELDMLDELLRYRYTNPEWIYSRRHPKVGMGFASAKTPGGLIELGVTLAGGVIEAAYLNGDFFSTSEEINQIESALRYCAATKKALRKRLKDVMGESTIFKVKKETIVELAVEASKKAKVAREKAEKAAEDVRNAEEEKIQREKDAMKAAYTPPEPLEEEKVREEPKKKKKASKKSPAKTAAKKKKPAGKKKDASKQEKKKSKQEKKKSKKKSAAGKKKPAKKPAKKPVKKVVKKVVKKDKKAAKKTTAAKKVKAVDKKAKKLSVKKKAVKKPAKAAKAPKRKKEASVKKVTKKKPAKKAAKTTAKKTSKKSAVKKKSSSRSKSGK